MDKKTIIESYKEHTFDLERYDIKYVEIGGENYYQYFDKDFISYEDLIFYLKDNCFHKTDEEILDSFVSDDEGKFINELAEKRDPEYYNSDNFDFDIYERDNAIYTGEFEKIPCIETGKFLIFRR
tara:strand:+ start:1755 stop:2129 length:375 start_codon:yes stop_codon:yes gene_type:complete